MHPQKIIEKSEKLMIKAGIEWNPLFESGVISQENYALFYNLQKHLSKYSRQNQKIIASIYFERKKGNKIFASI